MDEKRECVKGSGGEMNKQGTGSLLSLLAFTFRSVWVHETEIISHVKQATILTCKPDPESFRSVHLLLSSSHPAPFCPFPFTNCLYLISALALNTR